MINRQSDMCVTAAASNAEDAIRLYAEHRPDVAIVDLQLGAISGVSAIRTIREQDPGLRASWC